MLVWKCSSCGTQMAAAEADAGKSFTCTACGVATVAPVTSQSPPPVPGVPLINNPFVTTSQPGTKAARCSRIIYIVLGIFLGQFGVHNLVAGYMNRGFLQLGLTIGGYALVFCTLGFSALIVLGVHIWAIVEIITTLDDADGVRMP